MPTIPILFPANFVAGQAVVYADANGNAATVSANKPLPVSAQLPAATALADTANSTRVVGPFKPVPGRSVILSLAGVWEGQVQVMRSPDNGVTMLPLTSGGAPWALFGSNCCEGIWEESEAGAALYLNMTITSGAVSYRISQ